MSDVERALEVLEKVVRQRGTPSHYVARHVLLALGAALRERSPEAGAWVERARRAGDSAGAGWIEAIQAELSMACAEFAQCVDPRYLPGSGPAHTC